MPQSFTKADVQKLLDASTPEEVEAELVAHGYEVEEAEPDEDSPFDKPDEPKEEEGDKPPAFKSGVNPFENRKDVAKRAMKKVGFPDRDEEQS